MAVTLEPESEFLSLCVNSSLKITCTSSTTLFQLELITNEQFNNSLLETKVYTNTSSMEDVKMNDSFTIRLESKSPLVSTVTLNAVNPEHNGTVLMCTKSLSTNLKPGGFANITIFVKGKLCMYAKHAMAKFCEVCTFP